MLDCFLGRAGEQCECGLVGWHSVNACCLYVLCILMEMASCVMTPILVQVSTPELSAFQELTYSFWGAHTEGDFWVQEPPSEQRVKVKEPDFTCWPHSLGAPQLDLEMGVTTWQHFPFTCERAIELQGKHMRSPFPLIYKSHAVSWGDASSGTEGTAELGRELGWWHGWQFLQACIHQQ